MLSHKTKQGFRLTHVSFEILLYMTHNAEARKLSAWNSRHETRIRSFHYELSKNNIHLNDPVISDQLVDTIEHESRTHTKKYKRKHHQNDDDVLRLNWPTIFAALKNIQKLFWYSLWDIKKGHNLQHTYLRPILIYNYNFHYISVLAQCTYCPRNRIRLHCILKYEKIYKTSAIDKKII